MSDEQSERLARLEERTKITGENVTHIRQVLEDVREGVSKIEGISEATKDNTAQISHLKQEVSRYKGIAIGVAGLAGLMGSAFAGILKKAF